MAKILLIGGGGYVGTAVANFFSKKKWHVDIVDNFIYGHEVTNHGLVGRKDIKFNRADLCETNGRDLILALARDADIVVFLAGLVGDPITKKYANKSTDINVVGLKSIVSHLLKQQLLDDQNFIFISTCSNYGLMPEGQLADETSTLSPLSLYAEAKVELERFFLNEFAQNGASATVLRFATAFGISPRMRFDLTVNQFTRSIALGEDLLVFDPDTWRPYCHVDDFARLIEMVGQAAKSKIDGQIFNAGGDSNNFTKRGLIELISARLDCSRVSYREHGDDPRNYRVSFDRVKGVLGFEPEFSVANGVDQVIEAVRNGFFVNDVEGNNLYGNYSIDG